MESSNSPLAPLGAHLVRTTTAAEGTLPLLLWRRGLGRGGSLHPTLNPTKRPARKACQSCFSSLVCSRLTRRTLPIGFMGTAYVISVPKQIRRPPLPDPLLQRRRGGNPRRAQCQSNSMAMLPRPLAHALVHSPVPGSLCRVLLRFSVLESPPGGFNFRDQLRSEPQQTPRRHGHAQQHHRVSDCSAQSAHFAHVIVR